MNTVWRHFELLPCAFDVVFLTGKSGDLSGALAKANGMG